MAADEATSPSIENNTDNEPNRREFMGFAFAAAASGLLLPEVLSSERPAPELPAFQQSGTACDARAHIGQELVSPGEIKSGVDKKGFLTGLIDLIVENRALSYYAGNSTYVCQMHTLRAYQGYQGWAIDPKKRVTQVGVCSPGPTLRPNIGDTVELVFLNRIDPGKFNQTTLTSIKSAFGHCDTVNGSGFAGPGGNPYPNADASNFPNCFHASDTTNLHWHGTHTDPGGFGDNVLVGVLPNIHMTSMAMIQQCVNAFGQWNERKNPTAAFTAAASAAMRRMADRVANNPEFSAQVKSAIANNQTNVKAGEWPQYWPGYYPYHFELPVWSGRPDVYPVMGQAPGTHWYHCHQHGSTSLQLLNGMAGALSLPTTRPAAMTTCSCGSAAALPRIPGSKSW